MKSNYLADSSTSIFIKRKWWATYNGQVPIVGLSHPLLRVPICLAPRRMEPQCSSGWDKARSIGNPFRLAAAIRLPLIPLICRSLGRRLALHACLRGVEPELDMMDALSSSRANGLTSQEIGVPSRIQSSKEPEPCAK